MSGVFVNATILYVVINFCGAAKYLPMLMVAATMCELETGTMVCANKITNGTNVQTTGCGRNGQECLMQGGVQRSQLVVTSCGVLNAPAAAQCINVSGTRAHTITYNFK